MPLVDQIDFKEAWFVEVIRANGKRETYPAPEGNVEYGDDGSKTRVWTDPKTGEEEFDFVMRSGEEIGEAEGRLLDLIWYNRHHNLRAKVRAALGRGRGLGRVVYLATAS